MRLRFAILVLPALAACDSGTEERAGVSATRVVMRPHDPVPPGSAPRGSAAAAAALAAPGPPATPALLERGRDVFLAFCTPCHGREGRGDGPVVARGFPAPPNWHEERLLGMTPEHVVSVITLGRGRMFPYAERVLPQDRWAVARYVKALQAGERPPGNPP